MMERKMGYLNRLLGVLIAGFMTAMLISGPAVQAAEEKETVVSGSVEAVKDADSGEVSGVKVSGHFISDEDAGSELMDMVGKKVRITGNVVTEEDGSKVFVVKKYEVLE